jgi:hypothetical protein
MRPTIGRIIHYWPGTSEQLPQGEPIAALVIGTHGEDVVDCVLFPDGGDCPTVTRRVYVEPVRAPRRYDTPGWAWPPRAPAGGGVQAEKPPREFIITYDAEGSLRPLSVVLRNLMDGRPPQERLLLERWAQAVEHGEVDGSIVRVPTPTTNAATVPIQGK